MNSNIIHLSDDNFEQNITKIKKLILVDFWAEWCGPCKMISPFLTEIAFEFINEIIVAKINIDQNIFITQKYNIRSIPALLLFNNNKMLDMKVGVLSKGQLIDFIKKYL